MRIGGNYKTYGNAQKVAGPIRKAGYKVDVKEVSKGFAVYKYEK